MRETYKLQAQEDYLQYKKDDSDLQRSFQQQAEAAKKPSTAGATGGKASGTAGKATYVGATSFNPLGGSTGGFQFAEGGEVANADAAATALPALATDLGEAATIVSKWKDALPTIFSPKGLPSSDALLDMIFGKLKFADGGGVGVAPSDTVPAMLTPGEFVIPQEVVSNFGKGFFDKLTDSANPLDWFRNHAKGYATGGMVSGSAFPSPTGLYGADRMERQDDFVQLPQQSQVQGYAFEKGGSVESKPSSSNLVQVDLRGNSRSATVSATPEHSENLLAVLTDLKSRYLQ